MTDMTATKRKAIMREMAKYAAEGVVSADTIRACASRHHISETIVRDMLVASGFTCDPLRAHVVKEVETHVIGVSDRVISPQEEALIRNGRLFKHMPEDDDTNEGGYVVAPYHAFVREREAIIRILDAHEAARKQMAKVTKT